MKTMILYATKYGATREIAERIASLLDGAEVFDLKSGGIPPLDGYDCVVIGSSVYVGRLRKEAREYVARHAGELKARRLGLFLSGIAEDGAQNYLDANYPKDVVAHAGAKALLGGVFDPAKGSAFERLVMRIVAKQSAYESTLSDEKIAQFAEAMKS